MFMGIKATFLAVIGRRKRKFFQRFYRHHRALALGLLLLVELLTIILFVIPFLSNNLLINDMAGHYYTSIYVKEYLWPAPIGWDGHHHFGTPLNQLYAPLPHWLIATLSFIMPIAFSFKLLVILAILLIPIAIYSSARAFAYTPLASATITLVSWVIMAVPSGWLGFTFYSFFAIGLIPNALATPFLFFYIGALKRSQKTQKWLSASILLTILILMHITTAIAAGLAFLAFLCTTPKRKWLIKHFGLALALAGFWVLPFLAKYSYSSIGFNPDYTFGLLGAFILLLAIPLAAYLLWKQDLEVLEIILFFGIILWTMLFGTLFSFPPQTFRLYVFAMMIGSFIVIRVFSKPAYLALVVGIALGALAVMGSPTNVTGVGSFELQPLGKVDGRIAIAPFVPTWAAQHVLGYTIPVVSGNPVEEGLFFESNRNHHFVSKWELREPREGILERLRVLNVNYIIAEGNYSFLNYSFSLGTNKSFVARYGGKDFFLYNVSNSDLIEVLTDAPDAYTSDWNATISKWFFSSNLSRVPVYAESLPSYVGTGNETVEILETSPRIDYLKFKVDATGPVPIYIKISEFPNWHAYVNGKPTKIYRAAPYFMLIYGNGLIELRYEQLAVDTAGWMLSVFGLVWLAVLSLRGFRYYGSKSKKKEI